jgi:hypothetical protein
LRCTNCPARAEEPAAMTINGLSRLCFRFEDGLGKLKLLTITDGARS